MQIRFIGEMTFAEMRQALYETLSEIEDEFAIRHSRGAVLYIQPTDALGDVVIARTALGRVVAKVVKKGPYHCAADDLGL